MAFLAGIAVLLILSLILATRQSSGSARVVVSFLGYTNLPNNNTRFALFSLRSQDSLAVRWRGNWVEAEGVQYNQAPIINRKLPWFTGMALKRGHSLTVAVGEPTEGDTWRFCVLSSRYRFRERLLDFSLGHGLPTGIGHFSLVDARQILNPTNFTTNSSIWLTK